MRSVYLDTEFHEDGRTIDLISIGMVDDAGREYYAVNAEMDLTRISQHPWLMENVVSHLPIVNASFLDTTHPDVKPKFQIAHEVHDFLVPVGGEIIPAREYPVELWAWYAAYDHVVLAQLFGRMIDLPPGIPMWTNDLRQEAHRLGLDDDDMPRQDDGQHNALADARHNKVMHDHLVWVAQQS